MLLSSKYQQEACIYDTNFYLMQFVTRIKCVAWSLHNTKAT